MDTIPQKESEKVEFKSSFDSECIETLVAFANTKGGNVFVGIDNSRKMMGDSSVKIYQDRIEFFNPGRLPDGISIEDLMRGNYVSTCRNKLISKVFKEINWIEKYGTGIRRVTNLFLDYGSPVPVFENFQHGFRVTAFPVKSDLEHDLDSGQKNINDLDNSQKNINDLDNDLENGRKNVNDLDNDLDNDIENGQKNINDLDNDLDSVQKNINDLDSNLDNKQQENIHDLENDLSENQRKILSAIQNNHTITHKELSRLIGISEKNVRINTNKLKEKGYLKRVGPNFGGY